MSIYQQYFALNCEPFSIVPDPGFLYPSSQHRQAVAHLKYGLDREGGFVLLTGEVGTGKTTLLEYFRLNSKKNFVILASTGISAIKAKGKTIHSFFLFPPRILINEKIKRLRSKVISKIDTILIDECSMIRCDVLDAIDQSLRLNRNSDESFGGIQIILLGDLHQLPPVIRENEREIFNNFVFDLKILNELGLSVIVVHGGGPRIKRELDKSNIKSKFIRGLRVTDKKIINIINGYQGGEKYRASLITNEASTCSKGAECCKKTGKPNPACDNKTKGCCSSAQSSSKKKKRK